MDIYVPAGTLNGGGGYCLLEDMEEKVRSSEKNKDQT
jgi:hypothetical protein